MIESLLLQGKNDKKMFCPYSKHYRFHVINFCYEPSKSVLLFFSSYYAKKKGEKMKPYCENALNHWHLARSYHCFQILFKQMHVEQTILLKSFLFNSINNTIILVKKSIMDHIHLVHTNYSGTHI